jgi:streptomycin 6-kinase
MAAFPVPRYLAKTARRDQGVRNWIAGLPGIVAGLAGRWSLQIGEPFQPGGQCSWTAPVTGPGGADLVLKVAFAFPGGEERDEAAGLRAWDGNGAVRLHAAHEGESAYALLMERCLPGIPLGQVLPEPEQDQVVAGLLSRLWAQPHGSYPFRPLAQMCAAWADEFEHDYAAAERIDPGLAKAGITLFRELPKTAASQVLLCTDLHGDNILAAQREPWLVIDPKPYVGDPAYDLLQHMLNCEDRLAADPAGLANRMAGLAGIGGARAAPGCLRSSWRWQPCSSRPLSMCWPTTISTRRRSISSAWAAASPSRCGCWPSRCHRRRWCPAYARCPQAGRSRPRRPRTACRSSLSPTAPIPRR